MPIKTIQPEVPAPVGYPEFVPLGHDHGQYFYLSKGSGQIVELRSDQHVEGRLMALAPRQFWERMYQTKQGPDWRVAQNAMIQSCHNIGIYDPARIRGRGAWWEKDHAVLHLGNRLIVKGQERALTDSDHYIYERAIPFNINYKNPLAFDRARKLLKICELISWEKPISARYLAGWLAIAPICGALKWRPHIWITAAANAGKSWTLDHVIRRILGNVAVVTQGGATEASLRQSLNSDARPVIFDEAESKTKNDKMRMDGVLGLARASSTDESPPIRKGSPDGSVSTWYVRSSFLFSSISYGVTSKEDERRIMPLAIRKDGDLERFAAISKLCLETLTDEYVDAFLARSIKMIPVIRENARVFGSAMAVKFSSHGMGDQIGTLLAGAYSLFSDGIITHKEAVAWIEKQDWSEQKSQSEDSDEHQCLAHILQHMVRSQGKHGPIERSVAELMEISSGRKLDDVSEKMAEEILGRIGIRGDVDQMIISVSHTGLAGILRDTPWSRNWGRTLRRIDGAGATDGTVRFTSTKSRGVEIPYQDEEALKE